jgi:ssDNA-binding Zn-finger/Zn-ribbon topoisomerase 1
MPELPMRLHPLAPGVKCPACGGDLVFVRVRAGYGDLYQCASGGACKCQIIHYRSKEAKACGYAVVYKYGAIGEWTACDMPAAASAKVRVKKKKAKGA